MLGGAKNIKDPVTPIRWQNELSILICSTEASSDTAHSFSNSISSDNGSVWSCQKQAVQHFMEVKSFPSWLLQPFKGCTHEHVTLEAEWQRWQHEFLHISNFLKQSNRRCKLQLKRDYLLAVAYCVCHWQAITSHLLMQHRSPSYISYSSSKGDTKGITITWKSLRT